MKRAHLVSFVTVCLFVSTGCGPRETPGPAAASETVRPPGASASCEPLPAEVVEQYRTIAVAGESLVFDRPLWGEAVKRTVEDKPKNLVAYPVDPWLGVPVQREQIRESIATADQSAADDLDVLDLAALSPRDRLTYRMAHDLCNAILMGWPDCPIRITVRFYSRDDLQAAGFDVELWDLMIEQPSGPVRPQALRQRLPKKVTAVATRTAYLTPFGPSTHINSFESSPSRIEYHRDFVVSVSDRSGEPGAERRFELEDFLAPGQITAQTAGMPHDGPWSRMLRVPPKRLIDAGIDLRGWARFERPGLYVVEAHHAIYPVDHSLERRPATAEAIVAAYTKKMPYIVSDAFVAARYIPEGTRLPEVRGDLPNEIKTDETDHEEAIRGTEWRNNTHIVPLMGPMH